MITNASLTKQFTFNQFTYYTDLDIEEDNQKIYHYCFVGDEQVEVSREFRNHSPYSLMDVDEFMCYLYDAELYY
jgi:hypothetical protein